MKLATTTSDFSAYTNNQEERIKYIHNAGFRYIDYGFGTDFTYNTGIFSADRKGYIEGLKRTMDSLGCTFVQAHSPMGRPIVKDESHRWFVEGTKMCIEACAELGIPNIVVHSGYDKNLTKEETFIRNKEFFDDLLHFSEKFGVNILVENFDRMVFDDVYWIVSATDLKEMIDYVNHPLFHGCWDAGHANMQPFSQNEGLKVLGEDVYAIHVQDNFGSVDTHLAPFFGTMSMDSLISGLLDINYKGYFTFEATNMMTGAHTRRKYEADTRLEKAPLALRCKAEELLYDIGKYSLEAYGCFEE